jgi:hypothetical protein
LLAILRQPSTPSKELMMQNPLFVLQQGLIPAFKIVDIIETILEPWIASPSNAKAHPTPLNSGF